MNEVRLDGCSLSLEDLAAIARNDAKVVLDEDAFARMQASRSVVERCVDEQLVRYGITTGFGKFCNVVISKEDNAILQKNLIMSHACGQGAPLPRETVRAMMALRAVISLGRNRMEMEYTIASATGVPFLRSSVYCKYVKIEASPTIPIIMMMPT